MSWENIIKVDKKKEPFRHLPPVWYVSHRQDKPSLVVDGKRYYYNGDGVTDEQAEAMKTHIRSTAKHQEWLKNKQEEE